LINHFHSLQLYFRTILKGLQNESSSFGWALLGWEKVLVEVTHIDPPLGDDSNFETKKGGFHNHILSVVPADADNCKSELKVAGPVTDPNFKDKVGKEKIKIKKVPLSALGPRLMPPGDNPILVAGFTLTQGEDGSSVCVNVKSAVAPEIKTKK